MENTFAVIFDVDGTMVNNTTFHKNAWLTLMARYGQCFTERDYHEKVHARSNDRIIRGLFGDDTPAATIQRIADEKEDLYRSSFAPHLREIPGLTQLLTEFEQQGISCGAVSNSPKGNVDLVLDGLEIRRFFKTVIDRDMLKVGKPDPEGLLRVAAELGCPAEKCLVFEDSSSGFKACRNAGMNYIAITAGTEPEELQDAYNALALLPDYTTLDCGKLSEILKTGK
jgi:HAD superfamily hydrolase (TIGR01509 family)